MAQRQLHPRPDAVQIAFLDLEASGLSARSWPVEVGWAFAEGVATSRLIRPDPSWTDEDWDSHAEALHGLNRALLERCGVDPRDICVELNHVFRDALVYSDAPDWDGYWLFRLFSAGCVRREFALHDFGRLLRDIAPEDVESVQARAAEIAPRRHRAGPDAQYLQAAYTLGAAKRVERLT